MGTTVNRSAPPRAAHALGRPPVAARGPRGGTSPMAVRIPQGMSLEDLDTRLPKIVDGGLGEGNEFLLADLRDDERTPQLIAMLIWHGFLPMGGLGMLLPKIHLVRCVMEPQDVHIGRKVKRRAKGFHLTVDAAWSLVVGNIQRLTYTATPGDCWLTDELAHAYEQVGDRAGKWRRGGVIFHSVELWHTASGELVAGEVGYTCGRVYSSCTGFTRKEEFPGTGSVQLGALGRWLERCGFAIWDLGMEMDYKREIGGRLVPRVEWARQIRQHRHQEAILASPENGNGDAFALISRAAPVAAAESVSL